MEQLNKLIFDTINTFNKLDASTTILKPSVIIKCNMDNMRIISISIYQYLRKNNTLYKNDITINNEASNIKLGFCTVTQLIKIFKLRSNIKNINCNKINEYIEQYKKINGAKTEPYIHISPNEINIADFTERSSSWFEHSLLFVNPNGLWFSIGAKWADKFSSCNDNLYIPKTIKDILDNINYNYNYNINGNWLLPTNVYALEFDSSLKIKKISTCAELHAFEKTYKAQNPSTIAKALNWDKIKKDWDGLILYPWKGMQCIPYYNKTKTKIIHRSTLNNKTRKTTNVNIDRDASYFNYNGALVSDAILGKIKLNDFISIWQRGWDEDSGIIWKNYDKVKLIRIV
jgi:hypothetical protein